MAKLGWVLSAVLGAVLIVGATAKTAPDDSREILLRIERQLILQNHELPFGAKTHFKHPNIGALCDGAEVCQLFDMYFAMPGKWEEKDAGFLNAIEKLKGKEYRTKFESDRNALRERMAGKASEPNK